MIIYFMHCYLVTVFFEPTDRRKATKVLHSKHTIEFASPNLSELREMANFMDNVSNIDTRIQSDIIAEISQLSRVVSRFVKFIIVTIGSKGVLTIRRTENEFRKENTIKDNLIVKLYPTEPLENIKNVSGSGDSFSSGVIHGILCGLKESECISIGFKAAKMTLMSKNTVSSNLYSINQSPREGLFYKYIK